LQAGLAPSCMAMWSKVGSRMYEVLLTSIPYRKVTSMTYLGKRRPQVRGPGISGARVSAAPLVVPF
jgi:hypothetical protein